jgi:hypothetical protein
MPYPPRRDPRSRRKPQLRQDLGSSRPGQQVWHALQSWVIVRPSLALWFSSWQRSSPGSPRADVVRMDAPGDLHVGEHVPEVDGAGRRSQSLHEGPVLAASRPSVQNSAQPSAIRREASSCPLPEQLDRLLLGEGQVAADPLLRSSRGPRPAPEARRYGRAGCGSRAVHLALFGLGEIGSTRLHSSRHVLTIFPSSSR